MISLFCKVNKVLKDSSDFRSLCRSNTRRWRSLFVNKTFEFVYPIQPGMLSFEGGELDRPPPLRIFGSSCWQLVVPKESILLHDPQILYIWVWLVGLALGHLVIKIVLHVSFCKHFNTCNKFAGLESYLDVSTREKIWCDHQFTCVQVL